MENLALTGHIESNMNKGGVGRIIRRQILLNTTNDRDFGRVFWDLEHKRNNSFPFDHRMLVNKRTNSDIFFFRPFRPVSSKTAQSFYCLPRLSQLPKKF